jgi:hypothetical protein
MSHSNGLYLDGVGEAGDAVLATGALAGGHGPAGDEVQACYESVAGLLQDCYKVAGLFKK